MVAFFGAAIAAFLVCALFVVPGRLRRLVRTPSHEEIARRAYEISLARGGEAGHDVDDWLQAEREFRRGAWTQAAIGVAILVMLALAAVATSVPRYEAYLIARHLTGPEATQVVLGVAFGGLLRFWLAELASWVPVALLALLL